MELKNINPWLGVKDFVENNIKEKELKIVGDVIEEPDRFNVGKTRHVMLVLDEVSGIEYKMTLNQTSAINLVKTLGKETKNWVGRVILIRPVKIKDRDALVAYYSSTRIENLLKKT
ncbi:MAG: hypothetical protein ACOYWZ_00125 [Bacillota bacterium]